MCRGAVDWPGDEEAPTEAATTQKRELNYVSSEIAKVLHIFTESMVMKNML